MMLINKVKTFKKTNTGDVMGVVRTLYPNIEVETILSKKKRKKS
jgi:uncharacterized protein (DUF736 family)